MKLLRNDRRRVLAALGAFTCLPAVLPRAACAQPWPARPIRLVVGFAPGGFTDVLARLLAQKLQGRLGQPVVVENRPGAAGTLGAATVAHAAADGYTLLLGHSNSNAVAPALYPKLPYDVIRDFTPIVRIATTPLLLTLNTKLPAHDVASFIALAKRRPGELTFGSSGNGSAQHLAAEAFMHATGVKMTHIPYKGSSQAMVDLLAGNVDLNFESPPNVLPQLDSGKLRVLAITSAKRSALLPAVPTLAQAGVADAEVELWFALQGPAKLPQAITQRLNAEVAAALNESEVAASIAAQGGEIVAGPSAEFAGFLVNDVAAWAQLVRRAGVHLD